MVTNNGMLSENTTKTAQQESFQAEVDQSSQNLNTTHFIFLNKKMMKHIDQMMTMKT